MSTICNYAVLRFQPYPETGEFANLGIVMLCNNGQFLDKVETRTRKRVINFFSKLTPSVFTQARHQFVQELKRVRELANANPKDAALQLALFKHLTAPSETMFRFSQPGTIVADDPRKTLEELFDRYVNHEFAQKPDAESLLRQHINKLLKDSRLADREYQERRLGNQKYHVAFPFVWEQRKQVKQAIRPLSFDLEDPKSILDKGDRWVMQMRRLAKYGCQPEDTVFICEEPVGPNNLFRQSYREVLGELNSTPKVRVIPHSTQPSDLVEMLAALPH